MLKKQYNLVQAKLIIEFKHDRELPYTELLALEESISTVVRTMASCESIALESIRSKEALKPNAEANTAKK